MKTTIIQTAFAAALSFAAVGCMTDHNASQAGHTPATASASSTSGSGSVSAKAEQANRR
jgi:hypothetical protein